MANCSVVSFVGCVALVGLFLVVPVSGSAQTCVGDCDGDAQVSIAELVRGVRIALGEVAVAECEAFDVDGDGRVTVSELILAVRAALDACVADTATPTQTSAPTATPTNTRTLVPVTCGDTAAEGVEECDDGNLLDGDGCSAGCELEPGGDVCAGIAPSAATTYRFEEVASGLHNPLHVAAPSLDPHRVFIVEQAGRILVVDRTSGGLQATPFLDISERVRFSGGNDERGLLSVAFHPDYETNGWFYVNYSCSGIGCPTGMASGSTIIARYDRSDDANIADADSEKVLLAIAQPYPNHNGGLNAFGPDGFMYIGMGDGGFFDDPLEAGQDDGNLLGKMLRVDVDVTDPPYWRVPTDNPNGMEGEIGLIWAKGLRNPWRFSFDRANGDLYIGDVGQDTLEEIDVQPGSSTGGENYGWDIFEGTSCLNDRRGPSSCPHSDEGLVRPVIEYGRSDGVSVTGGIVYRGCSLPALRGQYFYSDFGVYWVRTFVYSNGEATQRMERTDEIAVSAGRRIRFVASYGEDARGELYIVDRAGAVFQLVADE